jgi:hypothetical protein
VVPRRHHHLVARPDRDGAHALLWFVGGVWSVVISNMLLLLLLPSPVQDKSPGKPTQQYNQTPTNTNTDNLPRARRGAPWRGART